MTCFKISKGKIMSDVADLLFQAHMLKFLPRSGYSFLGNGKESVAEHSFVTAFIGFVMASLEPKADTRKLICMCLIHDLIEARTGDLNYVQKKYVTVNDRQALKDTFEGLLFGSDFEALVNEFDLHRSYESRLAHDADQLAFVLDLKSMLDKGDQHVEKWLAAVKQRIMTTLGQTILKDIMATEHDNWWLKNYVDRPVGKK